MSDDDLLRRQFADERSGAGLIVLLTGVVAGALGAAWIIWLIGGLHWVFVCR